MRDALQSRLAVYYAPHGEQPGPLRPLAGGWDSELYTFTTRSPEHAGAEATWVLKTYAPTADGREHAAREWCALSHLHAAGYPVPRPRCFEPDPQPIGRPFIVIEYFPGQPLWDAIEQADDPTRERLTQLFVARLVELHALDPHLLEPAAPADQPLAYVERELTQLRAAVRRSPYPALNEVVAWLERHKQAVPCAQPAIVHRDYHPWNVLVDANERLVVIDWDWQIGDFRFDLAWALTLMRRSGFDEFSAMVERSYARQSGRSLDGLAYFEVMTTLRWLLNVLQALEPDSGRSDESRAAFREFLVEPFQRAAAFLRASTGADVWL